MKIPQQRTYALVHGAWHDAWCMEKIQAELGEQGFDSIAVDVPALDPTKDFDHYAQSVANTLKGKEDVVGVFHSRSGNYAPRAVDLLNNTKTGKKVLRKVIYLAASFEPETLIPLGALPIGMSMPVRNSADALTAILNVPHLGPDMTMIDPDRAEDLFYHDVDDPDQVSKLIGHLRAQHRPKTAPVLEGWPTIPQEYIVCTQDKVIRPEWQEFTARHLLALEPTEINAGHSPFVSRPKELARMLIELGE